MGCSRILVQFSRILVKTSRILVQISRFFVTRERKRGVKGVESVVGVVWGMRVIHVHHASEPVVVPQVGGAQEDAVMRVTTRSQQSHLSHSVGPPVSGSANLSFRTHSQSECRFSVVPNLSIESDNLLEGDRERTSSK